jgi:hypothetical protein
MQKRKGLSPQAVLARLFVLVILVATIFSIFILPWMFAK